MSKTSSSEQDAEELAARLERQRVIYDRLKDLLEVDPIGTVTDMANISIATLAKTFPPSLSKDDRKKIKDNYPSATNALIEERSMSAEGIMYAVATAVEIARISIDYSPLSHFKDAMKSDEAISSSVDQTYGPHLMQSFSQALKDGMTPFGAATTMVLLGASLGSQHHVAWPAMTRSLLDGINLIMGGAGRPSQEEIEAQAIALIMQQMGISKSEAKKYLAYAKMHGPDL